MFHETISCGFYKWGYPRIIHLNRIFHCQGQIETRSTRCEGITKSRTLVAFGSPASGLKRDVPTYFGLAGTAISSRLVYPKFVSLWISLQTAQCSVDIIYIYIFCKKNQSIWLQGWFQSYLWLFHFLAFFVMSTQCALGGTPTHWGSPTLTRAIEALVCLNQLISDWQKVKQK